MRVLLIDVNCKNSSTGNIVYNIYSGLIGKGYDAAICYGRGKKINYEKNIYKFGLDLETKLHALLTRLTGFTGIFSFFSTLRLIKFIKKYKPTVIHIHELHAYFVNVKMILNFLKKNNSKYKIYLTLHCEFNYTGKCGHAENCLKFQKNCGKCPKIKDYPKSIFFDHTKFMFNQKKKAFSNFDFLQIITPSSWIKERCQTSFLKNYPIRIIHNGIDAKNIFYPRVYDDLINKHNLKNFKIVLSVAPDIMSDNKGGKHIVKLAQEFLNCKEKVKFILIGVKNLEEQFPENVIPLGHIIDKNILAKYYSLADCFLICSKNENFPTTCLEAQTCGTMIAGFDVGGVRETMLDFEYQHDLLCEYGDILKLKENVESIFVRGYNSTNLSIQATNLYDNESMIENHMKMYQEN